MSGTIIGVLIVVTYLIFWDVLMSRIKETR